MLCECIAALGSISTPAMALVVTQRNSISIPSAEGPVRKSGAPWLVEEELLDVRDPNGFSSDCVFGCPPQPFKLPQPGGEEPSRQAGLSVHGRLPLVWDRCRQTFKLLRCDLDALRLRCEKAARHPKITNLGDSPAANITTRERGRPPGASALTLRRGSAWSCFTD